MTCPEGVCVRALFQQPELCGMSARARARVTLRMVVVLFFELFFFGSQNFALILLKVQLAHPPSASSAFPNAGESVRALNSGWKPARGEVMRWRAADRTPALLGAALLSIGLGLGALAGAGWVVRFKIKEQM